MRASCLRCHSHESNKDTLPAAATPPVSLFAHCFVWVLFQWWNILSFEKFFFSSKRGVFFERQFY
jgi:hypothetical protein